MLRDALGDLIPRVRAEGPLTGSLSLSAKPVGLSQQFAHLSRQLIFIPAFHQISRFADGHDFGERPAIRQNARHIEEYSLKCCNAGRLIVGWEYNSVDRRMMS